MNVFQKAVVQLTPRPIKEAIMQSASVKADNFSSWMGKTFFGIENSTLETNENIFSVVSRIANTVSGLPFKKYRNYEVQNDEMFDRLMYNPNPNQTLDEVLNVMEVARNTNGNGYALIFRDIRGQFDKLVPMNPNYVEPVQERNTEELWYRVNSNGKNYYFHNFDVIHVKHISGNGNLKGISPIAVLKNSNDFDRAVRTFSLKEMESIRDSFILTYDANVSDELKTSIIENFRQFYEDNGGVLFQEPGVGIQEINRKFEAADMKITETVTRDRIANVYNIPNIFLNADSDSYNSNEQLMQLFVNMTLMPVIRQYEKEFNKKILTKKERIDGCYFKFNLNALLRGDSKTRQLFYHGAIRDGWMTPDEVRALEELPPKGGRASETWISGDMYPMDMPIAERKGTTTITNDRNKDVIEDD